MLYYQCTIIIFTAATKKSQNSNFIKKLIIYDTLHAICLCMHCLTHNDRQEQYWRLQQIITVLVIHINCSGWAKPDIISTWWAFYFTMLGYKRLQRLITLATALYRSRQLISSFLANIKPSVNVWLIHVFSFLFGLLLRHNTDYVRSALYNSTNYKMATAVCASNMAV